MILVEHNWLLYIAAFACAFAITLVTTPFAKWLSVKCGAIDYPKDRGVHKKPMPRMGGVAIVLGFTITVLMVNYFDKSMDSRQFAGFLVGALLIAGLGVVDDMKNLPAKLKFCVQILAAKHAHNQRKQGIALEYAEDTRYRKHKAKERRACIAHKDFRRVEVSGKEAQTSPCQCRR